MITLDTSALVAIANRKDRHHERVLSVLQEDDGPWLIPAGVLGEAGYMLEAISSQSLEAFIGDLLAGTYLLHCGENDWQRILDLVRRYKNLPLGLADASVIACAEQHRGLVLTLNRRDLDIVAREGHITVLPAD